MTRVRPHPLGASLVDGGVRFVVFSSVASAIELSLFDDLEGPARATVPLAPQGAHLFAAEVTGIGAGQLYGLRVDGPYEPRAGHRCNPHKLLVDPYARAIAGAIDPSAPIFGHVGDDAGIDRRDDARGVPRSVVVDPRFDWGDDRPPAIPWSDLVIYEAHVKGLTRAHPALPPALRGTYAGLGHPAVIEHLVGLGVNAIELLPIHEIADETPLAGRGLTNYWGYSTLGYFAPAARYAASGSRGEQVAEFKAMVRALHRAGIEVILDVVYNHSGEGGPLGPTLSLRGLDNFAYYRLRPGDLRHYVDTSGTGNSLDLGHPQALRLVTDSLRYWAQEMRVDGFRFDLAPTLARDHGDFDPRSRFFAALHQDPILSQVKLIAEPWDVGAGGYRLGGFPAPWAEWNGKFRDTVRRFWRGDAGQLGELATRLTGSSDLFAQPGRSPQASVNYVTCHDGFTLRDLVSYSRKHNEANGEDNRDGSDHEHSANYGVEGPTRDRAIAGLREQQQRNLLATLLLAHGVPMILAGDERDRTQGGNNNAYCQDNEVSWVSWATTPSAERLNAWVRRLIALRRDHPVLRREAFLRGARRPGGRLEDVRWLRPDGAVMTARDWSDGEARTLGMLLGGDALADLGEVDTLLLLIHAGAAAIDFTLPTIPGPSIRWTRLVDSARPEEAGEAPIPGERYRLAARSLALVRLDRAAAGARQEAAR